MTDPEPVAGASAFDQLYREHGSPVRNYLRLLLGNRPAADDLTQEIFLHLWRRPDAFEPSRGPLKSYLLGVARKKASDWWRRNPSRPQKVAAAAPPSTPDSLSIRDALDRLPEELRNILWLREVEGLSYDEIAASLSIPTGPYGRGCTRRANNCAMSGFRSPNELPRR